MDIKFGTIKALMEAKKYIATDEIVWNIIKSIKKMRNGNQKGQDIYSICLEGPAGAGKSFYAKTYSKVLADVFDEDVEFLEYSCDSTTGKADLYEEIRVAAAITDNADEVIIAGMLVEAIDAVNSGKKVVLLLDEFEKSRRETDSFMYQFLQDGKIKTTQRGVVEIKPEYKKNLQVILCKNDERELSDPLLRRNHIIRLDVMTPKNFIKTVNMNLSECDEDIRNLVTLLYEKMYEERDDFAKFPSCSEGMLAIQDACDLLEENAPAEVIFADILSNLLKHPDDIETFKLMNEKDTKFSGLVSKLQQSIAQQDYSARDEIYRSFFAKEIQEIAGMKERYENGIALMKKRYESDIGKMKNTRIERVSQTGSNQEDNQSSTINLNNLIDNLNLPKFEETDEVEGEIIDMPAHIVNNYGSVFDGSDEWYEIMEFEVNEEGWDTIQELVEKGFEAFREAEFKRAGLDRKTAKENGELYYMRLYDDEEVLKEKFFKKVLCYDGMILDELEKTGTKIVCRKEKRGDKNFYKIYSNRRIQYYDIFIASANRDMLNDISKKTTIGINGLKDFLKRKERFIDCSKNYLLFSPSEMAKRYKMIEKSNSLSCSSNEKQECIAQLEAHKRKYLDILPLPGLFLVSQKRLTNEEQGDTKMKDSDYSMVLYGETSLELMDLYEKLLAREHEKPQKEAAVVEDDAR